MNLSNIVTSGLPRKPRNKPVVRATEEDALYTQLCSQAPLLSQLVDRLQLVSLQTGQPMNIIDIDQREENRRKLKEYNKLDKLAKRIFSSYRTYTYEECIGLIMNKTKVNRARAVHGMTLLNVYNIILQHNEMYYL